VKKGD